MLSSPDRISQEAWRRMKMKIKIACALAVILFLFPSLSRAADPGAEGDGDFKIGPTYTNAPELTVKDGVPRGELHEFTMNSEDSKIYPGLKGPYKRKVCVYVPAQYVAGTPAP